MVEDFKMGNTYAGESHEEHWNLDLCEDVLYHGKAPVSATHLYIIYVINAREDLYVQI